MNSIPASDWIIGAIFVFCLFTMVAGALLAVLSVRLIRGVCGLAVCCFGLAGLFYFLRSPFLALMEILIYVGAVCVTMVFAIMLAEPDEPQREEKSGSPLMWGGVAIAVAAAVFWGVWRLGAGQTWTPPATRLNTGALPDLGKALLGTYSLAFELISLALVVAIIGALAIARTGRRKG